MIKKLDKLILKAFAGPFIVIFFICLFVFMMQIVWKYIDDLVGKGLDLITIFRFIVYASATLVTLALPIAILLSSIMTFGKLGENFELVAIKSSGISFFRFMRPLLFISVFLAFVTFLFANYIIPVAHLKFATLYSDIYRKSPAFNLKDGVFYNGFRGYSIKVSKKEKDSLLHQIIIYEQSTGPQDNSIIAENGLMKMGENKKYLELKLINGSRYEEKGEIANANNEFIRMNFKEYNKLFDLKQLDLQLTPDSLFRNSYYMQTLRQLDKTYDSVRKQSEVYTQKTQDDFKMYLNYLRYKDSSSDKVNVTPTRAKKFSALIPDSLKESIHETSVTTVTNLKNLMDINHAEEKISANNQRGILIEWHKKFSLSFACIVLFLIGSPLGSIIRKGGLGFPTLIALLFFTIFHLLNTFGDKLAKQGILTPMTGVWLPVIVLFPVGLFFTYKATHDSQLFNKEFYYRFFRSARTSLSPVVLFFTKNQLLNKKL